MTREQRTWAAAWGALIAACVGGLLACQRQAYVLQPPKHDQGDAVAVVSFVTDTDAACRQLGADVSANVGIAGCAKGATVILPNPCAWPNESDYRDIACHELGHRNGWPPNHPTQ